jgi:hypothetical protein
VAAAAVWYAAAGLMADFHSYPTGVGVPRSLPALPLQGRSTAPPRRRSISPGYAKFAGIIRM